MLNALRDVDFSGDLRSELAIGTLRAFVLA
jgi:hypothetical protein